MTSTGSLFPLLGILVKVIPIESWEHLIFLHLGLSSGYPQFPSLHTLPFSILTLCTSTLSPPTTDLVPHTTSHQSEWLRSKTQVTADSGKDVEKEEQSSISDVITSWYNSGN